MLSPHAALGGDYVTTGQLEKALEEELEALKLAPGAVNSYASLGISYIKLNRLDEAEATFEQAIEHKLDGGELRQNMYYLAFLRENPAQMQDQIAWSTGKPRDEDALLSKQSDTEAFYGRLSRAREFSRRAVDSATLADSKERRLCGQCCPPRGRVRQYCPGKERNWRISVPIDGAGREALTLARIGDLPRAKALAEELEKSLKLFWLPCINAAISLSMGKFSDSLMALEAPSD